MDFEKIARIVDDLELSDSDKYLFADVIRSININKNKVSEVSSVEMTNFRKEKETLVEILGVLENKMKELDAIELTENNMELMKYVINLLKEFNNKMSIYNYREYNESINKLLELFIKEV